MLDAIAGSGLGVAAIAAKELGRRADLTVFGAIIAAIDIGESGRTAPWTIVGVIGIVLVKPE
jgi:hypothetical protein